MSDLIKALTILLKYGDPHNPTHCEHDELFIANIDPNRVSCEDLVELDALGFYVNKELNLFYSYRFGSA